MKLSSYINDVFTTGGTAILSKRSHLLDLFMDDKQYVGNVNMFIFKMGDLKRTQDIFKGRFLETTLVFWSHAEISSLYV